MKIAECLLKADGSIKAYGEEELKNALPPIISIRNKTKKAQGKYPEDSGWYKRLLQTIEAMVIAEEMIERELSELR